MEEEEETFFDAEEEEIDLFFEARNDSCGDEEGGGESSITKSLDSSSMGLETSETHDSDSIPKSGRKRKPKHSKQKLIGRPKKQRRRSKEKKQNDPMESEDTEPGSSRVDNTEPGSSRVDDTEAGTSRVDNTSANQGSSAEVNKRQYKKRKGHLLMPKKKAKKKRLETSIRDVSATESGTGDGGSTSNADVGHSNVRDDVPVVLKEKRKYKKRKGQVSMPEKAVRRKLQSGPQDDGYESVEGGDDGDDHAEYEYKFKTPPNSEAEACSPDLLLTDFLSDTEGIEALAFDLSQLLAESQWIVDTSGDMCRVSMLGPSANVYVAKAVTWRKDKAQIFVYNRPLPETSIIWGPQVENSNSLCDVTNYIMRLTTLLGSFNVCSGVTKYDKHWHLDASLGRGTIESDIYEGRCCFRSANCILAIINSGLCQECKKQQEVFRKRDWKVQHSKGTDGRKINNKFLPRTALLEKVSQVQTDRKNLRRENNRLRKRIKRMIERESIDVDHQFGQDLVKVLKDNVDKMSDIQRMFWSEQLKALSRQHNPRSMRWSPMMIKIALHLQMISPAASKYLHESGILTLPSERRLFDFTHFVDAKEGVQEDIINLLKEKLEKENLENHEKFFNLLFDELTVRADVVLNRKGEIIGCVNMTGIEASLASLETELVGEEPMKKPEAAKKVLVYMLQGISLNVQEIVGIFATTELSAEQLCSRTWDVTYHLEIRGIKVLSFICDGASCNKKFFKMHASWDPESNCVFATRNIASGEDRAVYFIVDPPHLLKTIRNCFSNSHGHKHSRLMWKNGEEISWEAIVKLHDVSIADKYKEHKLTRAHIILTAFSRMNVLLATQVMSSSVALSLKKYLNDPRFCGLITNSLISFLLAVNTLFDCLNGSNDPDGKRNKKNNNLDPYTSPQDKRFEETFLDVLKFFDDWYNDIQTREGNYSKEDRERMFISMQSYESIHITVNGFIGAVMFLLKIGAKSVDAKKFNQDKLEQYFGLLRMSGGGSNNPSVKSVINKSLSLTVQKGAAMPSAKGNTGGERKTLTVNQEPLPCRPKKC